MKKDIKVFAADIDGTLAGKGEDLLPLTKKALEDLHAEGVLIGPASGRPLDKNTIEKSKAWGLNFDFDFAIGLNGGDLWTKDDNKIHRINYLKPETIKKILEMIWDLDINAIIYRDAYADILAKRIDEFLLDSQRRNNSKIAEGTIEELSAKETGKIEVHLKHKDLDELMRRIKENESSDWAWIKTFEVTPETALFLPEEMRKEFGDHVTIEFQDPAINKVLALKKYLDMKNIEVEKSIAFGDMQNDTEMIRVAGIGVCMLNGCDESKEAADFITEHACADDGVGHFLYDHIL